MVADERMKTRVDSVFDKYGEPFLLNGTTAAKGFFSVLAQAQMNMYFDSVELAYITRPGLICYADADLVVAPEDTIELDGRVYTIKKMSNRRIEDTVVLQVLVMI